MACILPNRIPPSFLATVLWFAVTATSIGAQTSAEADAGAQVRDLFAAKCLECHHPESENTKARRNFDGGWDLALVAAEWGDPIAFDLALLWEVVQEGSMPPEDSDIPPLTEVESQLLLDWVKADTPMPADSNRFVDLQMAARYLVSDTPTPAAKPNVERSFQQRLRIWLGRNHAAAAHFPVALLLLAALMRLFHWGPWRTRAWRAEGFCLSFGAPLAVITASLGWLNANNSGAASDLLERHRWIGVAVATVAILLWLVRRKCGEHRWFALVLFALALAVAIGGHQGGELVFGESYLEF